MVILRAGSRGSVSVRKDCICSAATVALTRCNSSLRSSGPHALDERRYLAPLGNSIHQSVELVLRAGDACLRRGYAGADGLELCFLVWNKAETSSSVSLVRTISSTSDTGQGA